MFFHQLSVWQDWAVSEISMTLARSSRARSAKWIPCDRWTPEQTGNHI